MKIGVGLIWGIIEGIMRFLAKTVYVVFSLLHLGPLFVYSVIGGIVHLIWNVFEKGTWAFTAYHIVGAILIAYAVVATVCSLLGIGRSKKKDKRASNVNIVEREDVKDEPAEEFAEKPEKPQKKKRIKEKEEKVYPVYSVVKQNPSYFMAEYEDRYELYYKTTDGYRHVRTDYKKE